MAVFEQWAADEVGAIRLDVRHNDIGGSGGVGYRLYKECAGMSRAVH